tara:strand:+ start:785 stop:1147 length:363 start_codon:yes stop_codon:yes gene_type:complete
MSEVTVQINNRGYGLSCDDGQEGRLESIGEYVDLRAKDISASGAANNENHLLVLTSLVLADEIFDMKDDIAHLQEQVRMLRDYAQESGNVPSTDDLMVAEVIEHLANKIENINGRISNAA